MDIAALNGRKVVVEYLRHRGACHVGALLGQAALRQIAARMLGIGHIHVGNDVHDTAVGLLRKTFVLTAIARLHVEYGDMQALGRDG